MKFRNIFCFLMLCLFITSSWAMLSVGEAMERIRQIEGIPDLKLAYIGLDVELGEDFEMSAPIEVSSWVGEDSILPWPCYVFKTDYSDNSIQRYYLLEPFTGQIILWYNPLNLTSPEQGELSDMLPKEQLIQSAINFIKKWHPDFDSSQYVISGGEAQEPFPGAGPKYMNWRVVRFHLKPSVIEQNFRLWNMLSSIHITLDSCTGEVVEYWGWHFLPVSISTTPLISSEEARQIALSILYNSSLFPYVDSAWGVVYGATLGVGDVYVPPDHQRLEWHVGIYAYSNNPAYQEEAGSPEQPLCVDISVNALTGEITRISPGGVLSEGEKFEPDKEKLEEFKKASKVATKWKIIMDSQGSYKRLIYPLVSRRGKALITKEQAWLFAVLVREKDEGVVLEYRGKALKLNSKDVSRRNGKTYVPLDEVLKLAGYSARYVPKEKTIYIEKKNEKKREHKVQ
ncbi:hypothetical protein H5T87_08170 [bacterium]|nr:hypothetical protein [bacterium]